jgi:hypothetical protein
MNAADPTRNSKGITAQPRTVGLLEKGQTMDEHDDLVSF